MKSIIICPSCSRIYVTFFRQYNFAVKFQVCLGGGEESLQNEVAITWTCRQDMEFCNKESDILSALKFILDVIMPAVYM